MATLAEVETTQYLSFKLDTEVFAIEISKVREVLEFVTLTKVPQTPPYMRGVINIRGSVVPVVDLKNKFGMDATEKTINTCIIIVEVNMHGENTVIGALTDSVSEVFEMESKNIEPVPQIGSQMNVEFIKGMGKRNNEFVIILDIDKVFSSSEAAALSGIAKSEDEFFGMQN
ncbi:chemotaxis protein CheW [Candidatus Magnetominusculus dajiuhuensis]|uniref:chemotaxis protein CheW n=1 Tax=Candidatus Magnetominusculus dajiuhuensis TaxID=3137712 RepID=UPI003B42D066